MFSQVSLPRQFKKKAKINKWDLIKLISFCTANNKTKQKDILQTGRKYLQMMQPTRAQFPKYANSSCSSITERQTTQPNQKMGRRTK